MRDGTTYSGTPIYLATGIVKDLELRLSSNGYPKSKNPDASSTSGSGDRWAGLKWCALHDGPFGMDMSFQYMHKFPTAGKGLGSGAPDDSLGLMLNKSSGPWGWMDVRIFCTWLGRPKEFGGGTVRQPSISFTLCPPLNDNWGWGGKLEATGKTALSPRMVTAGCFLSRKITSQCYSCVGVDMGLNQDAPKLSAFLGISYWLGPPRKRH